MTNNSSASNRGLVLPNTPPQGVGEQSFKNVVAAAHTAYLARPNKDVLPSVDDIKNYCQHTKTTINKVIVSDEFKITMARRGVNWYQNSRAISPEQAFAISIVTNPTDRRDMRSKLKSAGISYAQYRAWLKQPVFSAAIKQIGEDMLGDHVHDVHTSLLNKAMDGKDINAIKLYYEITGRHDPAKQQMVDLERIIGLLLEVITRYVTDPVILTRISGDVEAIMAGKTPKYSTVPNNFDGAVGDILDAQVVDDEDFAADGTEKDSRDRDETLNVDVANVPSSNDSHNVTGNSNKAVTNKVTYEDLLRAVGNSPTGVIPDTPDIPENFFDFEKNTDLPDDDTTKGGFDL